MSQLLINNNLASAGIDIYSGRTSLYREVHYYFFCTFPLGMTSAAHIHAKCSVTISEEKKTYYYSILLGQQNSVLKKSITVPFAVAGSQEVTHQKTEWAETILDLILHLLIKCSWKWRGIEECQINTYFRVSMYCTNLNNKRQSPHKTSSSGFPPYAPLIPGQKNSAEHFLPTPTHCW